MAKMLDFTKMRKPTFSIKLPDESVIQIYTPTKGMLEELINAKDRLDMIVNDDQEALNELYEITARLMSNNKTARVLTSDKLAEMLDVGDVVMFFNAYAEFIAEQSNGKN